MGKNGHTAHYSSIFCVIITEKPSNVNLYPVSRGTSIIDCPVYLPLLFLQRGTSYGKKFQIPLNILYHKRLRIKMDLAYIDTCPLVPCNPPASRCEALRAGGRRDWSLWLDFKILFQTVKVVLLGEGR